jgi:hypothetical protein
MHFLNLHLLIRLMILTGKPEQYRDEPKPHLRKQDNISYKTIFRFGSLTQYLLNKEPGILNQIYYIIIKKIRPKDQDHKDETIISKMI